MADYRRRRQAGGTYFFTVVTAGRRPILTGDDARALLRAAIETTQRERPFSVDAAVLLPEHLHMIWTLPRGDDDYATRWRLIKGRFTHAWTTAGGDEISVSTSAAGEQRRGVWQRRFMEHTIRDEDDYLRHVEYIHYNPVKHGWVVCPIHWPHSTFHRFVRDGVYDANWSGREPPATFEGAWLE